MSKILGLDLGTNSIGWAIRNSDLEENQFERYGVAIFEKGVGRDKAGEFSYAAKRTQKRSVRRLYQARKYWLWATLEVLIQNDYCPMTMEQLDGWRKYDKINKRKYPHIEAFEKWIRLDFDGDMKPDFTSPYQIRSLIVGEKLDLSKKEERYKIGRAFYHIAQRRGFKSSRKDANVNESGDRKDTKSEIKKDSEFSKNLKEKFDKTLLDFSTIGTALGFIENKGERIRLEWIQHTFRKHYRDEIKLIFEFQNIGIDSDFYKSLVENSTNRYNGAIFYQRPLRSQKGLVGFCTLEKNKPRSPISHPAFELFRAWSFLNNIEYKPIGETNSIWQQIPYEYRQEIYDIKFTGRQKPDFNFVEIAEYIKKKGYHWELNYKDKTSVSSCPIAARLRDVFGDGWERIQLPKEQRKNSKSGKDFYTVDDIWHVLFSFDDDEAVKEFAIEKLQLTEEKTKKFVGAWNALPEGYSMLSINAIKKINKFLLKGFIYTESVLLANIPDVIGQQLFDENEELITKALKEVILKNREDKQIANITNNLISIYKSLPDSQRFAEKNQAYKLDDSDKKEIHTSTVEAYGLKTWDKISDIEKQSIVSKVESLYQIFFTSVKREYVKLPRVDDSLKNFIRDNFNLGCNEKSKEETCKCANCKKIDKLYHPSMIDIYPASKRDDDGKFYLRSPKTGSFKNPMAMRTLFILRKQLNYLIKEGHIDEDTRVVVELARELNDSNKRWAIETYQRNRQNENNEFADIIRGLLEDENDHTINANPESNNDIDKIRVWFEQLNAKKSNKGTGEYSQKQWNKQSYDLFTSLTKAKSFIDKYRLWKEQKCQCIYTGRTISLCDLFDENKIDFEHTIPRSISFDNSMENLTVCFASYNRYVKKNQIPTQLPNYEKDVKIGSDLYTAIQPRLKEWEVRIEQLKVNIEYWKGKSKSASTKDYKDDAIRQKHLWQFELSYWQNKYQRFTMTEITTGFKNSQLTDTQIISKYAFHYLKSVFKKVEVQKGLHTSEFRKIYGIQPRDEKKDRSKHSHHAIDAAVLTLIPATKNKEEVLQKYFSQAEVAKLTSEKEKQYHERPYKSFNISHILKIEDEILINNITRDQALSGSKKILRKRGRIIYLKDKQGIIIKDNEGKPIPMFSNGDSIRGQLHQETFLGAIKLPIKDANGKYKIENGKFLYDDKITYVVREPFVYKKDANSPGFKNIEDIEKSIVDKHLLEMIIKQIGDLDFKTAMTEGVYLVNKDGGESSRIRHIRIFVRATEPLKIKEQTYISNKTLTQLSDREHKKYYYAANDKNHAYALYEGKIGTKSERDFRIITLFDTANLSTHFDRNLSVELEIKSKTKNEKLKLLAVLRSGQKVLFYKEHLEELKELNAKELSNRLYRIIGFEKDGRIKFKHHLVATREQDLVESSDVSFNSVNQLLRLNKSKFSFIVDGPDFILKQDGQIVITRTS